MSKLSLKTFTMLQTATSVGLSALAWVVTGVRPIWNGSLPSDRRRIYSPITPAMVTSSCCRPA